MLFIVQLDEADREAVARGLATGAAPASPDDALGDCLGQDVAGDGGKLGQDFTDGIAGLELSLYSLGFVQTDRRCEHVWLGDLRDEHVGVLGFEVVNDRCSVSDVESTKGQ